MFIIKGIIYTIELRESIECVNSIVHCIAISYLNIFWVWNDNIQLWSQPNSNKITVLFD